MSKVKGGQFILSGIDARNGAFGIIPMELDGAVVTNDFWHFEIDKSIISDEYFLWLTSTPYFDDICKKASDGTTNRIRLQADRFYSQELMIPEIAEQHKVVEELKATDNKIKKLESEFQFQLTQLELLNQAILQEAVQGKLVKQDPKDEPASELLKRIKAEKAKSGKKEKPLPPIKPEEIPFEIPKNWVWCRLGEIADLKSGNQYDLPKSEDGVMYVKVGDMNIDENSYEIKTSSNYFERKAVKETDLISVGSIIFPKRGGAIATNKRRAVIQEPILVDSNTMAVIPSKEMSFNYFFQWFTTIDLSKLGNDGVIPQVNNKDLNPILIPLPPLSDQTHIVAEIEKQLAKTKQLKEHIIADQQATEQLLKALLHGAFEVEEKEEVN